MAGWIFFLLYFFLFPFAAGWVSRFLAERMIATPDRLTVPLLYHLVLLLITVVVFHRYLLRCFGAFFERLPDNLKLLSQSLLIYLGVSVLLSPLTGALRDPNLLALADHLKLDRASTLLITLVMIPIVAETLFRGLVFDTAARTGRVTGYVVSALLFALANIWQHVFLSGDWSYFVLVIRYAVPGLVLTWCYERSGSIWTSILLHSMINAVGAFLSAH